MTAGDLRVFGRHPDMTPAARIFLLGFILGRCDRHPAMADIEVKRGVDLGIIEFHQHIVAGDAKLSSAERDKTGDVETAHADQVETWIGGGKAQLARLWIDEGRL